jgi:TP901 family phage tail tape measure protein
MAAVERRIRVVLEDNATQYETHMRGAAQATQQFGEHAAKSEQATSMSGRAMQGLGSLAKEAQATFLGFVSAQAVMNVVSDAVGFAKDTILGFNDAMTQSTAIMGTVSDQAKQALGTTARQVAVEYNTAVQDVAKGYYFLISAGYDVESSQLAIGQVTAFAKAGMFDLERATELAADAQNAMGLKSDDANENLQQLTRVTDVLTKANIDANGSVEQFAEALTNKAAGASRLAGISLEETVGVLEAFAAQGVKGKRAGEDYSIVLRDLSTHARTDRDAFEALGITVFDASGRFAGWSTIVGQVEHALNGMTAEQKNATLATLGLGAEASAYLQVLLGTSTEIDRYTAGVRNAGGATQQVAEKQMQSMVEQLKHIRAQAAELGLKAFDGLVQAGQWMAREFSPGVARLVEVLRMAADAVTPLVKALAGIAGETIVAGLTGIARALEAVAGYAAENETAVRLLATAGFLYLATTAAQAGVALASPAFVAIGGLLLRAADAALLFQARLATAWDILPAGAMTLSESLGVAKTAAQGLWGILNTPVVGLAIVSAAVYGVVTAFQSGQQAADRFLDRVGAGVNPSSLVAVGTELDSINRRLGDLRTRTDGLGDMAAAFADLVIPIHDVEGSLLDTAGEEQRLAERTAELTRQQEQAKAAINDLAHSLSPLWQQYLKVADSAGVMSQAALGLSKAKAGPEIEQIAGALSRLAAVNNVDLTMPHDKLIAKLRELYQTAQQSAPVAQLHGALTTLGDSASTGADRVKALKDALDALIGVHVSAAQAEDQFAGALDGLNGKLGAGVNLADAYNVKNREAREAVLSAVDAATKHAVSVYEETGSIQQATGVLGQHREQLVTVAEKLLNNTGAAQAYINMLNLTPADIMTLVQADTARAQGDIGAVQGRLGDVKQGANATITADASQAMMVMSGVEARLYALNHTRVMAQIQAAGPQIPLAHGGILAAYADGGIDKAVKFYDGGGSEDHRAMIAGAGSWRVWAEPETGGEAYIPLSPAKRDRSTSILGDVAGMFGFQLVPYSAPMPVYQPGAVNLPATGSRGGGGFSPVLNVSIQADANVSQSALTQVVSDAVKPAFAAFTRELRTELRTR